jgi:biotin transport system substrate-specific component
MIYITTGESKKMTKTLGRTHEMVYIAVFAVLIAVCSWISIPTEIPFTLQTMGVVLAGGILGGKRATIAVLVYILLGAVGVPVFSGFTGGLSILAGTTGGYIIGFLGTTLVMWLMQRCFGNKLPVLILSMVLGILVCYAFGTLWFAVVYAKTMGATGLLTILGWCVFPFIIPDLIKIAVAILIISSLQKVTGRRFSQE